MPLRSARCPQVAEPRPAPTRPDPPGGGRAPSCRRDAAVPRCRAGSCPGKCGAAAPGGASRGDNGGLPVPRCLQVPVPALRVVRNRSERAGFGSTEQAGRGAAGGKLRFSAFQRQNAQRALQVCSSLFGERNPSRALSRGGAGEGRAVRSVHAGVMCCWVSEWGERGAVQSL